VNDLARDGKIGNQTGEIRSIELARAPNGSHHHLHFRANLEEQVSPWRGKKRSANVERRECQQI
jgi:hypothetical protein